MIARITYNKYIEFKYVDCIKQVYHDKYMNNMNFHYDQSLRLQLIERMRIQDFLKIETF